MLPASIPIRTSACPARANRSELMRLGHDADQAVERQHRDHPRPMPDGVARENLNGSSDACMPSSPPTTRQPSGINMKDRTMMRMP